MQFVDINLWMFLGSSMKRLMDMLVSFLGLLFLSPVLAVVTYLIWKQDHHSPFYVAPRVGKGGRIFQMVKLRSMWSMPTRQVWIPLWLMILELRASDIL